MSMCGQAPCMFHDSVCSCALAAFARRLVLSHPPSACLCLATLQTGPCQPLPCPLPSPAPPALPSCMLLMLMQLTSAPCFRMSCSRKKKVRLWYTCWRSWEEVQGGLRGKGRLVTGEGELGGEG